MKPALRRMAAIAAVTTTTLASALSAVTPALAAQFGEKEVDQNKFVAVASPYRGGAAHQLLILEQVADSRPCWSESGTPNALIAISPLLLEFDFTGICSRSTDSNGYSIRVNDEDLGLRYSLRIVKQNDDMLLIGAPSNRADKALLIGRTNGVTSDFAKITLDPGWRFTKRVFGEQTLGHVYLTYDGDNVPVANIGGSGSGSTGSTGSGSTGGGSGSGTPTPVSRFSDTVNDIYAADINRAVETGFISGFEDNTFRPTASLTREQLVSIVLGALGNLPNVKLNIPTQAAGNPYSDVESSRWSAARIQFARDNNIITGYQDGSFRPAQPVTRAELMAVLRRAAEYGKTLQGQQPQIQGNRPAATFGDTNGHWASPLISQMSSYCGVASPLNETGSAFAPDAAAQRNYAAAATLRTLSCLGGATGTNASR
ncbi:MAG: DUF3747 domain-containing protein [Oscillatoriophycideae cyanobacterium NC_groundwater_1537_Pr4_S-0.65um_50_18]|nr:DUF3747 domain-containing protein [Oscillatoriophycideae cyanobacterium NC_groundwater_1537_Pr4_S-0.65um_50_18]